VIFPALLRNAGAGFFAADPDSGFSEQEKKGRFREVFSERIRRGRSEWISDSVYEYRLL